MSGEEKQKADELKKLLAQVPASGSFESVNIAQRIATLAREIFTKESDDGKTLNPVPGR
jgi:hypothetical protein